MSNKYVGLFFYINNHLVVLKTDISKGERNGDFINHPVSHFVFFHSFNNDPYDDYGHYPRGRVIYNLKADMFDIYMDKWFLKNVEIIINEIKKEYNLTKEKVCVVSDPHYTHDYL